MRRCSISINYKCSRPDTWQYCAGSYLDLLAHSTCSDFSADLTLEMWSTVGGQQMLCIFAAARAERAGWLCVCNQDGVLLKFLC